MQKTEVLRYIVNGLFATSVHYGVLNFNLIVVGVDSIGLANMIASLFGIMVSFIGSRYYVYREHSNVIASQVVRFILLYAVIAVIHGLILYIWSDFYGLSYHLGFIFATLIQINFSYFGNKLLVFIK